MTIVSQRLAGTKQVKRGMKGFAADAIPIKLSSVLVRSRLPALPRTWGHLRDAAPKGGWGMLGNDNYGDCVMVGAAHEHMIWSWATDRTIPSFDTAGVVKQYLELAGGQDEGLDPVATARWRLNHGIVDTAGKAHKIDAFVQVGNLEELDLACYLGGCCAFCWFLPDNAEQQFSKSHVWDDVSQPPDPNAGHYTPYGGINSKGVREFITWERIQGASREFCEKYMCPGGCIAYLSREYMTDAGTSPEAINWNDLNDMLRQLR